MDRDHEFPIPLPGEGAYVVKPLEGVRLDESDGTTVGHWPAFGLEAEGPSEAEVYDDLVGELQQRTGGGPGSPEFETFAAYVREHGTRLSDEEVAALEL